MSEITKDDIKLTQSLGKAQENYPTLDFVKSLKSARLTKRNGTKVEYKIEDRKDLLAFADARKKAMRMEMDAGQEHQSKQRRTRVKIRGQLQEVPEAAEESLVRSGKAETYKRVKPTAIYRDGQWYRKIHGDWVPEE